jgi:hypothetical protein
MSHLIGIFLVPAATFGIYFYYLHLANPALINICYYLCERNILCERSINFELGILI